MLPFKLLIDSVIPHAPSTILFLCSVILAAWYGGLRPGLLAVLLSAPICYYFFLSSHGSLLIAAPTDGVRLASFLLEGVLISVLSGSLHEAKHRAEMRARELHGSQEILRQSEQRFRLLTECVRDYAISFLDPSGRIVSGNVGTELMTGYPAKEVIGRRFSSICAEVTAEVSGLNHELAMAARDGRFEQEGWRRRKNGTRFWADDVTTALRDDDGKLLGFSKVTRDLTERKRAQEALRKAKELLESRVKERTMELEDANLRTSCQLLHHEARRSGRIRGRRPVDRGLLVDNREASLTCATPKQTPF
jgi:PAS domain S-box-containing protein